MSTPKDPLTMNLFAVPQGRVAAKAKKKHYSDENVHGYGQLHGFCKNIYVSVCCSVRHPVAQEYWQILLVFFLHFLSASMN